MTSAIIKHDKLIFQPKYFDRFHRYFGFSLKEIDLREDCRIIQSVEDEILITFAWNQCSGRKVEVLKNSFIRVIDTDIRFKWKQLNISPELLTNVLWNIELGLHHKIEKVLEPPSGLPIIDSAKITEIQSWMNAEGLDVNVISKFKSSISRREIRRLDWNLCGEAAHLSNDIIDYYMLLLIERNGNKGLPKTHSMPANIWEIYSAFGYTDIRERYWMETFLLNFDILLIPICESRHWHLAIVDMRIQTIRYYDSLGLGNAKRHMTKVFEFLNDHSRHESGIELNSDDWNLEIAANIPMQKNGYDCGVFCCQFAEFISRDCLFNFDQKHMKYFRKKMLYEIYKEQMLN